MSKIIVGCDGGAGGMAALRLAGRLTGGFESSELMVVASFGPEEVDYFGGPAEEQREKFHERARQRAAEALGTTAYTFTALDGPGARVLHDLAEAERADLIVVGPTRHGTIGRILIGTTTEKLLKSAPCAVAVAPTDFADGTRPEVGVIGVAYNGEPDSFAALEEAARLARATDSELRVITVGPTFSGLDAHLGPVEDLRAEYRDRLAQGVARIGGQAEAVYEEGPAAEALSAKGIDLDLLVLGSRGYGPVRRVLTGSTAEAVVRTAPCPVLVVPRAAEDAT